MIVTNLIEQPDGRLKVMLSLRQLDKDDRAEIREHRRDGSDSQMCDLLEYWICNGWDTLEAAQLGDMADYFYLGTDLLFADDLLAIVAEQDESFVDMAITPEEIDTARKLCSTGEWYNERGLIRGKVWYYGEGWRLNPVTELLKHGYIYFDRHPGY